MRPSLGPADATGRAPAMPSDRKFNEKSVIRGYFNPKFIIFAIEINFCPWLQLTTFIN